MKQIVTTAEEIQQFSNAERSLSAIQLKPYIRNATGRHLLRYLDRTTYNVLATEYETDALSAKMEALLPLAQEIVVIFALVEGFDELNISLGSSGATRHETEGQKSPFQYEGVDYKRSLNRRGYFAVEQLLSFLEENAGTDYPNWLNSTQCTKSREFLIPDTAAFERYRNIYGSRQNFKALAPYMRDVEQLTIQPLLSTGLFAEVKLQAAQRNIPESHQQLHELVQPVIAHYAWAEAVMQLPLEIIEGKVLLSGFEAISKNARTEKKPALEFQELNRRAAVERGRQYQKVLKEYLDTSASETLFSSYFESTNYSAPIPKGNAKTYVNADRAKTIVF